MKTIIEEGERPITSQQTTAGRASTATLRLRDREQALQIKTILVPLDFSARFDASA